MVEADESYGTFKALRPDLAVLTNVEPDHLDYYGTFEVLREAFSDFVAGATLGAVACADDEHAAAIGRAHGATLVGEAAGSDYVMEELSLLRSSVSFRLRGPDGVLGALRIGVPGLHNARNAAVAAVAALRAGAPFAAAESALARFAGVSRRFEFRGEANGVTFVDDYAHLPTEVRAALATARSGGWSRIVAVFQPHRFSRTAALADQFGSAFVGRRRPRRHRRVQRGGAAGAGGLRAPGGRRRIRPGPAPAGRCTRRDGRNCARRCRRCCNRATSVSPSGPGTSPCCPTSCSTRRSGEHHAERAATCTGADPRGAGHADEAAGAADHVWRGGAGGAVRGGRRARRTSMPSGRCWPRGRARCRSS